MTADVKNAGDKIAQMKISDLSPLPDFIQTRQVLWEQFKARYEAELEVNKGQAKDIKVQAKNKDGELRDVPEVKNWLFSPIDIARKVAPKSCAYILSPEILAGQQPWILQYSHALF